MLKWYIYICISFSERNQNVSMFIKDVTLGGTLIFHWPCVIRLCSSQWMLAQRYVPYKGTLDRDVTERYDPEEFAERSFALHALQTRFSETSVEKGRMSSVYVCACLPKHNSCFIVVYVCARLRRTLSSNSQYFAIVILWKYDDIFLQIYRQ